MNKLTYREDTILNGLKAEYSDRKARNDFSFIEAIPTWHIRLRTENEYTSQQIRYTLRKLERRGYVSSDSDGTNILWAPAQEECNE